MSTVTMEELELETAELLPSRETLCCCPPCHPCCRPCCPCFEVSVCVSFCR
jgi:hypothetical protein